MFDLYGRGWQMIEGGFVTIQLCLSVLPFMFVLGLVGAWAKLSRIKTLNVLGDIYTTVVRGVPELLIILIIFYGLPTIIQNAVTSITGGEYRMDIPAFWAGVMALALVQGAFASEVFRAAILAVPKGQMEAATAAGMSPVLAFRRVMLPQVWRYALPGLSNLFQVLIKDTSLIMVVGLEDILRKAYIGAGAEKAPFTFFLVAAAMFLVFTTLSLWGFNKAEKYAMRGVRRA